MKFKRTWEKEINDLPVPLRVKCIDYKAWKKSIKSTIVNNEHLLTMLVRDMERVDSTFKKVVRKRNWCPSSLLNCRCPWCFGYTTIYNFIKLNKTCVYKIAKKCDKHRGTRLMSWYNTHKTSYGFCGGCLFTFIQASVCGGVSSECPVCMEEHSSSQIILNCGHCICPECVKVLFGIQKNEHGTLTNLINYALYQKHVISPKCPLCRAIIDCNVRELKV
jgi:hypothetical protein